jgi:hypothetical protein
VWLKHSLTPHSLASGNDFLLSVSTHFIFFISMLEENL